MNFQDCPHYDEILNVLTEGRNFEIFSSNLVKPQVFLRNTKKPQEKT